MDTVAGGPGNDELRGHYDVHDLGGGPGQNRLRGGFANDTINAPDGEADTIDCDKGKADTAIVGSLDTTVLAENVRLQAPPE
jgi:hypothetical protein